MDPLIYFTHLGCAKNQVDTERMRGLALDWGFQLVDDPRAAAMIVVNTCGFITEATSESIETLLELAQYKTNNCRVLVMAGCLVQRHAQELRQELPEVDYFIGTTDWQRLAEIFQKYAPSPQRVQGSTRDFNPNEEEIHRSLLSTPGSAFLKIAEGCDRRCAFCIIPKIRGPQQSRTIESLVSEAQRCVAAGVKELIVIAQDTTAYGHDLRPRRQLADLLAALDADAGLHWIRLMYTYPTSIDDQLIATMSNCDAIVPYLDIPIQHIDDDVLRRMRRGYTGADIRQLIQQLRNHIPDIFLRTTLLTGHPGESPQAFNRLIDFINETEFDHLGVFPFSPEVGTDAANQSDPVPAEIAHRRAALLMEHQQAISRSRLTRLQGRQLEVLIEGVSDESEFLLQGRHAGQSPEVDGTVILTDCAAAAGEMITACVTDTSDYDLVASANTEDEEN